MSAIDPKQTSHRYGDLAERDVHVNVRTGFIQEIAPRLGYGDTSESILLIDWLILYTQELTAQKHKKQRRPNQVARRDRESSYVIRKDMSWSFARCLSNERIIGVWKCF